MPTAMAYIPSSPHHSRTSLYHSIIFKHSLNFTNSTSRNQSQRLKLTLNPLTFPYISPRADITSPPSPSPAPEGETVSDTAVSNIESEEPKETSLSLKGINGEKKAGIAIGVIAGVCGVGVGGVLYKKWKDNIERAQLGYATRGDF